MQVTTHPHVHRHPVYAGGGQALQRRRKPFGGGVTEHPVGVHLQGGAEQCMVGRQACPKVAALVVLAAGGRAGRDVQWGGRGGRARRRAHERANTHSARSASPLPTNSTACSAHRVQREHDKDGDAVVGACRTRRRACRCARRRHAVGGCRAWRHPAAVAGAPSKPLRLCALQQHGVAAAAGQPLLPERPLSVHVAVAVAASL